MASPDTDELATVPLPAGEQEARQKNAARPQVSGRADDEVPMAREAAEAPTVEQERVSPERIEPSEALAESEADQSTEPTKPAPTADRGRWWRGLTGSLAAGLAVLALGVLAVGGICLFTGAPGPGAASLIGHPLAAVLALGAQRVADRRRGLPAVGGGVAVVLFAVSAATIFWLS
ncbi:hypothetical protein [Amycolatopsis rifamycinica]|uniref:Uncharacterized protein n=1 Tax=Amycolatopsis rifamycinica TaxID=287986 RepID=A0A066TWY7_9PSEU|nr:hypothetical protein [Amycolatopsis rifamycinica]KDN19360.1 hypothetical protein DV20_25635 [Amycolatopsis rifamycinica]